MDTLTAEPELFAYPMDSRQSSRVLEHAIRERARVTLEPRTPIEGWPLVGRIVEGAPESICIQLDNETIVVPQTLTSMNCDAILALGQERYLFSTNIMTVVDADLPTRLEIARCDTLHVMQRRHFWRSGVRESTAVDLSASAGRGSWRAQVALLNVGFDGVACKVPVSDANRVAVGERLRVRFTLPESNEPFDFEAEIRNKQPAGTDSFLIVGLQFAPGERSHEQRRRLAKALGYDAPAEERTCDHG